MEEDRRALGRDQRRSKFVGNDMKHKDLVACSRRDWLGRPAVIPSTGLHGSSELGIVCDVIWTSGGLYCHIRDFYGCKCGKGCFEELL